MSFDLESIRESIRKFNECLPYCAQDFIVDDCFHMSSRNWNHRCAILSVRVEALASLFLATGAGVDARHRLATGSFVNYYWDLVSHNKDIFTSLSKDVTTFSEMLEKVHDSIQRKEGVLVSKLLHWSFPKTFPMMDENCCTAIESKNHLTEGALTRLDSERRYERVIDFYLRLHGMLGPTGEQGLEEYDYESQPKGLKVQHSWLRVVDKWLWLEGRRINSNAIRRQSSAQKA